MSSSRTTLLGLFLAILALAVPTHRAAASDADAPVSIEVREPAIESVGINFTSEADEERISEDLRAKVADRGGLLATCYALHASREADPEASVTVDWTITTSGKPVGFTVFSSIESLGPCIRRTLSDLTFEHLDDAHPRARVRLRFR